MKLKLHKDLRIEYVLQDVPVVIGRWQRQEPPVFVVCVEPGNAPLLISLNLDFCKTVVHCIRDGFFGAPVFYPTGAFRPKELASLASIAHHLPKCPLGYGGQITFRDKVIPQPECGLVTFLASGLCSGHHMAMVASWEVWDRQQSEEGKTKTLLHNVNGRPVYVEDVMRMEVPPLVSKAVLGLE